MSYQRELEDAKRLALTAGEEILKIYEDSSGKGIEVTYKEENMPLTLADQVSNHIIMLGLRKEYPTYGFLSEEEKDNRERLLKKNCFIVDPLDGTKEFIKRNGQFTVNIGLAVNSKAVMGVIYAPVTKELYYATEGDGAYKEIDGERKRLMVSERIEGIRAVASGSHDCDQMENLLIKHRITDCVKIGSSLKGCIVAEGKAEIYYRFNPTMEWDTAAMQCIVEEAGGIFKQMDDSEMRYNREDSLNSKGFYIINRMENRFF